MLTSIPARLAPSIARGLQYSWSASAVTLLSPVRNLVSPLSFVPEIHGIRWTSLTISARDAFENSAERMKVV